MPCFHQLKFNTTDNLSHSQLVNRRALLPETLALSGQTFFSPRDLPPERYHSMELVLKKEIPVGPQLEPEPLVKRVCDAARDLGRADSDRDFVRQPAPPGICAYPASHC